MRTAKEAGSLLPPKHILNAPTKLMKSEGYGSGYDYDHDAPDAFSGQDYFPEALGRQQFYDPPERGFEREIRKRLEYWAKLRRERSGRVSRLARSCQPGSRQVADCGHHRGSGRSFVQAFKAYRSRPRRVFPSRRRELGVGSSASTTCRGEEA